MERAQSLKEYFITATYGKQILYTEKVCTIDSKLDVEVEKIAEISRKVLRNRNIPYFHNEIVIESEMKKWSFIRVV